MNSIFRKILVSCLISLACVPFSFAIIMTPPMKYVIMACFFLVSVLIFSLVRDKNLILVWFLLFVTAVDRMKIFLESPYCPEEIGVPFSLAFLIGSVLFLAWRSKSRPIELQSLNTVLLFYGGYLLVSLLTSLHHSLLISFSLYELIRYSAFILAILFWERISRNVPERTLDKYLLVLFFIGALQGILAVVQVMFLIDMSFWTSSEMVQGLPGELSRAQGTVGSYTGLGNYLSVLFPFTLSLFFYKKTFLRLTCLILIIVGLILTFTRVSWIGAAIGALAVIGILLQRGNISIKKIIIAGMIGIILLACLTLPFLDKINVVMKDLLLNRGDTLSSRMETYRTGWRMAVDSHFLGIGLKNYWSLLYKEYFYSEVFVCIAHNSYLVVLVESGAVGLIFFLLAYFAILKSGYKLCRQTKNDSLYFYVTTGMIGAVISFLISSTLNMTVYYDNCMNLLWNIMAVGLICGQWGYNRNNGAKLS